MSFTKSNDYLDGRKPTITCDCSEVAAVRYPLELVAADLDANDIGAVGILPAGSVPVALYVDSDDLDTNNTPTIVASVGLLNAAGTDLEVVWGSGLTVCQAGGQVAVMSKELARTAAAAGDRKVGMKFTAGAATKAAGEVGVTLLYRAA
jgi:hypothetical protein